MTFPTQKIRSLGFTGGSNGNPTLHDDRNISRTNNRELGISPTFFRELDDAVKPRFVGLLPNQPCFSRIEVFCPQHCELVTKVFNEPDMSVLDQPAAISWRHLNDVILQPAGGEARRHPSPERAQYSLRFFVDRNKCGRSGGRPRTYRRLPYRENRRRRGRRKSFAPGTRSGIRQFLVLA